MLIAYQVALEVVVELRPLVAQIAKHDSTLSKQLVDAASSIVQNLFEGIGHRAGNRRARWEIAFGEANEVKACLDVAQAWGYVVDDSAVRPKLTRCSRCAGDSRKEVRRDLPVRLESHHDARSPLGIGVDLLG